MAVRVWSRVQVLRPRASTSGGQSGGGAWGRMVLDAIVEDGVELEAEDGAGDPLVIAAQDAKDVQLRQLSERSVRGRRGVESRTAHRTVCHLCPARRLWVASWARWDR